MRNFNDNRNAGGRGSFGGNRGGGSRRGNFGGGRDRGRPDMHRAICADCGNSCEVPFKPTSSKPVYCNNCFRRDDNFDSRGGGRSDRRGGGRDFGGRSNFEERRMYKVTCSECGNSCEVPFKPTSNKPVYCDDCFSDKGGNNKGVVSYKEDFEALNKKLDKVLKILDLIKPKKIHIIEKSELMSDTVVEKSVKKPTKKEVVKKTSAKKKASSKKASVKKKAVKKK